ncbi:hypothetical protein TKK_0011051 [Trichogramma kaykai]
MTAQLRNDCNRKTGVEKDSSGRFLLKINQTPIKGHIRRQLCPNLNSNQEFTAQGHSKTITGIDTLTFHIEEHIFTTKVFVSPSLRLTVKPLIDLWNEMSFTWDKINGSPSQSSSNTILQKETIVKSRLKTTSLLNYKRHSKN